MRAPVSAYASKRIVLASAGTGVTGTAGTGMRVGGVAFAVAPGADRVGLAPGTRGVIVGTGNVRVTTGRLRVTLTAGRATGSKSSTELMAAQKPSGMSSPTRIATTCQAWRRPPSERPAVPGRVTVRSRSVIGGEAGAGGGGGIGAGSAPNFCGTQPVAGGRSRPKVVSYAVTSSGVPVAVGRSAGSAEPAGSRPRALVDPSRGSVGSGPTSPVVSRVGSGSNGGFSDTGSPRLVRAAAQSSAADHP